MRLYIQLCTLTLCAHLAACSHAPVVQGTTAKSQRIPEVPSIVSGKGTQDIVLLGGLSASKTQWNATRIVLGQTYRVHLVLLPGLGGESADPCQCIDEIADVSARLGAYVESSTSDAIVVAHSAGGLAALQLAHDRPGLIKGLVILDTLPFSAANFGARFVDQSLIDKTNGEYQRMLGESTRQFAERMQEQLAGAIANPVLAAEVASVASTSDRRTYASLYRATMLADLRGLSISRGLPTFVIYADQSPNGAPPGFMRSRYRQQYAWLSADRLLEIQRSKHYVMLDQPKQFLIQLQFAINAITSVAK
ncbi:alpha/beta fold hydrolase [Lysobacter auxotrophicus]|uniref:Alpha/beta hydrolase n=1 Tax=Lysobacter auxotrophicus TaxID=2992573 RepID=A0ABN6UP24_9GAMM|nr:alpha/beta hydrolase [Lysobacter auxotrophicus]BDU18116.1 alpha/beta hydrolase [Lysobacter auxotrophicus]